LELFGLNYQQLSNRMEEEKPRSFVVRIGPKLKQVLDQQKKQIEEVTYDVIEASDYEAGEIIAVKLLR